MMEKEKILNEIFNNSDTIRDLYERIRIVNPITKKEVILLQDKKNKMFQGNTCYQYFNKCTACENCVSMRAFLHRKTYSKIETDDNSIYMVHAIPIHYQENDYVLELIHNISDDFSISEGNDFDQIIRMIKAENIMVVKNALTNFYNIQYIYERLPNEIALCDFETNLLVVFLIKIKNLEWFNNRYGEAEGDLIIRSVAQHLQELPQNNVNWLSYYKSGGFVYIVHVNSEGQIRKIYDSIQNSIDQISIVIESKTYKLSIDIGYYLVKNKDMSPEQVILKANDMILTGKKQNKEMREILEQLESDDKLTFREREILLLLIHGKTNLEIADELFISLSTVKKYISFIFEKYDVKTRSELISKITLQ